MIVTTTNEIEGRNIVSYMRVVAGETIVGINALKDFTAGLRNIVGGRSAAYEGEAQAARESALAEMVDRAIKLGADAVVGVHLDYSTMGQANNMLMVSATGTAVKLG